jgi:acyl carrier protein
LTTFSASPSERQTGVQERRILPHAKFQKPTKLPGVTPVTSMLFDQIKNYLVETAGVDSQKFENPELKVADLKLDSLGLIEMLFEVEDKYGFQIPDPMIFLPMTFAEMVGAIDTMVQEHTGSQALKD